MTESSDARIFDAIPGEGKERDLDWGGCIAASERVTPIPTVGCCPRAEANMEVFWRQGSRRGRVSPR